MALTEGSRGFKITAAIYPAILVMAHTGLRVLAPTGDKWQDFANPTLKNIIMRPISGGMCTTVKVAVQWTHFVSYRPMKLVARMEKSFQTNLFWTPTCTKNLQVGLVHAPQHPIYTLKVWTGIAGMGFLILRRRSTLEKLIARG